LHAWRKLRWLNLGSNYSRTNGDCVNYDIQLNGQVNHVSAMIKRLITFLSCNGLYIGGESLSSVHTVFLSSPYSRAAPPQSSPSRRRRAIGIGRAGSSKPTSPRVPTRGRGRIRFLGSAVVIARRPSTSSRRSRWSASTVCLIYFCIVLVPTNPL
jgi:hypothetical protein